MALSVNTNVGAMVALQNLNKTTGLLEQTQLRVTTGLKVNSPKDDASTFAIAQTLRGEIAGVKAVKGALANGESIVNTAVSGGMAIADLVRAETPPRGRADTEDVARRPHPGAATIDRTEGGLVD